MNFWNEKVLREAVTDFLKYYRGQGIGEKIRELEDRIDTLAKQLEKPKPGRPRKVVDNAKND